MKYMRLLDMAARGGPVSSVKVIPTLGGHDVIQVWNRGGLAGTLTVALGDGIPIAKLLCPEADIQTFETTMSK